MALLRVLRRCINVSAQKVPGTQLNVPLSELDPEIANIISMEQERQRRSIDLIASENFTSKAVLQALGSVMTNKYSEGYPKARYYGGNQFIDMAEELCKDRALNAFHLSSDRWGVNVQPLSGSPCNFYVYTALLSPHERLMALDLPHGGHLSHGFQTDTRKVSATSIYFESLPYRVHEDTGLIDYDQLEAMAKVYRPKLIVGGASAYPREFDYERMRHICDMVGAYFMYDMAHTSGLIAANVGLRNPFDFADVVTTTTHKSLRGPRGAMIFYRKGTRVDTKGKEAPFELASKIDNAVFPGHQGGPHNHTISALAVALKLAMTEEFRQYQEQVLLNAQALAKAVLHHGFHLVTGGTENHLMLVDLRNQDIDGARVEKVLEKASIAANKNTIPTDKSAFVPMGLRLGTPAMTTRGFEEPDFVRVAEFLKRGIDIAKQLKTTQPGKKLSDYVEYLNSQKWPEIEVLRKEVEAFAQKFPGVGQ